MVPSKCPGHWGPTLLAQGRTERGCLGMDQVGQLGKGEDGPLPLSATCGAQPVGSFAAADPEISWWGQPHEPNS